MAVCEDELICDFAEVYHIYDYRALPADYTATLCAGLRESSRVMMKVSGGKINLMQTLLARAVDELAFQSWAKTRDGQKNRNRPKSVLEALTQDQKEPENEAFDSPEAFHAMWESIVRSSDAG